MTHTEQHSVKAHTEYTVLALDAAGVAAGTWTNVDDIPARSAEAAVRQYAEKTPTNADETLTLVAIPARYWKPLRVARVRKVTLEVSEA